MRHGAEARKRGWDVGRSVGRAARGLGLAALVALAAAAPAAAQGKFDQPQGSPYINSPPQKTPPSGDARGGFATAHEPAPPRPRRGSGTGFYVNATHLVTNAHVVESCASMRDPYGRSLIVVRIDHDLDLALLRADTRSDAWLTLAAPEPLRLGSIVYVMGFPFYGDLGNSVIVTRGVVSSRSGYRGRLANFSMTAQIQPGNSGGPVLDVGGRVIGVAVSQFVEVARPTEVLPHDINFAISAQALGQFLTEAGTEYDVSETAVADLEDGVPVRYEQTVLAILCD